MRAANERATGRCKAEHSLEQFITEIDGLNGEPGRITTGDSTSKNIIPVRSYRSVLNAYVNNAESKFNGPDGKQCCSWMREYRRDPPQNRLLQAQRRRQRVDGAIHAGGCLALVIHYDDGRKTFSQLYEIAL